MNIREFIEKAEEIEGNSKWLSKQLGMNVEVYLTNDGCGIRIENDEECKYREEFNTIEELSNHLDAIAYGVMLSKGIEI